MLRKSRLCCCISSCSNSMGTTNKSIAFFRFPQDGTEIRQRWEEVLSTVDYVADASPFICSLHFDDKYLFRKNMNGEIRTLLRFNAVPNAHIKEEHGDVRDIQSKKDDPKSMKPNEYKLFVLNEKYDAIQKKCEKLQNENQMLLSQIGEPMKTSSMTKCGICHAILLTLDELNQHVCMSQEQQITCEYCSTIFKSTLDLRLHFSDTEHSNITFYKCEKCEKSFASSMLLEFHSNSPFIHPPPIEDANAKKTHSKLDGGTGTKAEKFFGCGLCELSFENSRQLSVHMKTHTKNNQCRYECYICKIQRNSLNEILSHFALHSIKRDRKCLICDQFLTVDELKEHFCGTENCITCEYCTRKFNAMSEIMQHLQQDHDNKVLYACGKCHRFFEMKYLRDIHERHHKNVTEENINYLCEVCSKGFNLMSELEAHIVIHSEERNHLCPECGKGFKTKQYLRRHIPVHGEKKFKCPDCPASFRLIYYLRKHSEVHQNLKFKCDECDAIYPRKGILRRHIRYIHQLKRPPKKLACTFCSMKFSKKDKLEAHIRTHTGEKPFGCEFCDRKYAQKGDLRKHLQTHVGANIYKCKDCDKDFLYHAELVRHSYEHYKQQTDKAN